MRGACSTLPRARGTGAARLGAQANRPLARPARTVASPVPPMTAILQPAAGDRSCLRASPSAAVPPEGANWCDLASEDGDSLTERILFFADGSHIASHPSHLSAAVPSVRKRSTVVARHIDFSRREISTSGAAVPIMDGNSAATGNMLPMATLRPRNETEHETVLAEQNTEHFTRTSPSQRTLILRNQA